jgi:hypothetical protein
LVVDTLTNTSQQKMALAYLHMENLSEPMPRFPHPTLQLIHPDDLRI